MERQAFLDRWLPNRAAEIARETTPDSWRSIVEDLNPTQRRIVADNREQTNVLVLAGPGSGKTRVLVHRIAYLLRVRRENPRGILALAYNRHAAVEIRRRLLDMAGGDARGVTVLTCHALAMRLVGASFAATKGTEEAKSDAVFAEVLREATALLRGDGLPPEEADTQRERLLAGFRWICVDEYQDIDPDQYELISALAGRTSADADSKLTLFAVGDDDQNIYSFMGASVAFIRRFNEDYAARPAWLTENYRSTAHIIDAANAFIAPARERMKQAHPIEIDRARQKQAPGGEWAARDPVARGRVQILAAGPDDKTQAMAAIAEFRRLQALAASAGDWDWRKCAIIARQWRTLDPVRGLCELQTIPAQMANDDTRYFWRLRETRRLLRWLEDRRGGLVDATGLEDWANAQPDGIWMDTLREAIADYRLEAGDARNPAEGLVEWLAEWGREFRRRQNGLLLLTAHSAKGLEFDHVIILDGDWRTTGRDEDPDAWRRLYYVAMTRARKTLALARRTDSNGSDGPGGMELRDEPMVAASIPELRGNPAVLRRPPVAQPPVPAALDLRRETLDLRHIDLSFPGRRAPAHPMHRVIRRLAVGDELSLSTDKTPWEITTPDGMRIGRLAKQYHPRGQLHSARVRAVVQWRREDGEPEYQDHLRCNAWEVVVPELVFA